MTGPLAYTLIGGTPILVFPVHQKLLLSPHEYAKLACMHSMRTLLTPLADAVVLIIQQK